MAAGRLKQIEEIYHAALEIAPEQREPFFAQHCGADEDLRREVESLLSFENASVNFIDTPPESLAAEMFVERQEQANLTGKQISHYKIKRLLGKGGMGEVYLAEDSRLKRRVALKILPSTFAADASRRHRFEQEARAASALNHPNILTVHEFGAENGIHFLATEFVEGETLRERIGGELSLTDALDIAAQTAFALSAAHAAGIVHRDIKPENIMIRHDGIVKILDFGIAKLIAAPLDAEGETLEKISTQTKPGALLGTLAYMSPEQIRGETLDARSDIFSLGVCLYEMLTGENPFQQATTGDVIAAILKENPSPVTQENAAFPAELERILSKALKKKRDERYQTSRDFLLDLKSLRREIEFSESAGQTGRGKSPATNVEAAVYTTNVDRRSEFSFPKWLAILLVAGLAIGGAWWFVARRGLENNAARQTAQTAPQTIEVVNWHSTPGEVYSTGTFSPDAKMVAFSSTKIGSKNIWVKQLSGGEAVQITKDDFVNQNPIWSPDGEEIAFFSQRGGTSGIWRMPSFGGNAVFISAIEDGGAVLRQWAKSGALYYESKGNLFKLDLKTTLSSALTEFDAAKTSVNNFSVSPDESQIACVRFENESYSVLTMPTGGEEKQIAEGADEIRSVVWHTDGRRVLFSRKTNGTFQIFAADAIGGKSAQITFGERDCFALDASADGAKILYGLSKEESDIWGANVEGGDEFSFVSDINSELWAAAAPDGKQIAFQSIKNLSQGDKIFTSFGGTILTKLTGTDETPLQLAADAFLPAWSPDGSRLAFVRIAGETYHLWTIKAAGGEEKQLTAGGGMPPIEFTVFPYNRTQTADFSWSPDGGKIVYVADELPRNLWSVDANDASRRAQLTANADANQFLSCPLWSADGKRVAFASKTSKSADGKRYFGAWIVDLETKAEKNVRQTENFQRLLGFSASGKELLLAEIKNKSPSGLPIEVAIIEVNIENGAQRQIARLDETYLYNIRLSADKKMLAYASHKDGKDNIWVARIAALGAARKITSNNDARLYFSALVWSPDDRTIYFGKQTRYSLLSMVTNFK